MKPFQIFASMTPERAVAFCRALADDAPNSFTQAQALAAGAFKMRPVALRRLPFEKRAHFVRRALSRVASDALAEEMLAVYFLECRSELLVGLLDQLGLEHEDGTLKGDAPAQPAEAELKKAVAAFRKAGAEDAEDRELLLRAFASQRAIDWPVLEALLEN